MLSMCFCVSVPNDVQERQMSMTHRSLLALALSLDVWDLPLVVHRCYRWCVAPLALVLCSKSFFGCILLQSLDCCNHWQNHFTSPCSTITFTFIITSTYEVVADAFVDTKRSKQTLSFLGSTLKTNHWKHYSSL
jgi:hypothetical protein